MDYGSKIRKPNNNSIIKIIKILKEDKTKTFDELNFYGSNKSLVFNNPKRYDNIENFHKEYYRKNYITQHIIDKGFVLKENSSLSNFYKKDSDSFFDSIVTYQMMMIIK